ncbi:helix-turn-helix domain-containing protein [Brevundimonas staleyi]|uniref:Helix-turn-helix domain-containing protein n=1 Tax=Brevundimonas staleyi TaxID=74326 RepID=A0ABW0FNL7_9CAUL
MTPQELDVIVRVAGATLLIWTAIRLRSDGRRYFAALAICLCGFLAGNTPDPTLQMSGLLGRIAVIATGYAAVFLWWWCLAVFDARFRPRGVVLGVGVLWSVIASADRGLFGPVLAERGLSYVLLALGLFMIGHLGWRLLTDRADDMIDQRRRARAAVVLVLGGQLLVDVCVDLTLGLEWQPRWFSIVQNMAILGSVAWMQSLDLTKRRPAEATPLPAPPVSDPLAARLAHLMEVERLYLDPGLSFADVVRAMGVPERQVRGLIHREGHDHFRSFLNARRVAEARRRLADPAHRSEKLIAIAFDCGFASLASFNRAFRDFEGRTPSAFRAEALGETRPAPGSEERSAGF